MSATTGTAELWLRRFHPAPAAPQRLICLPHAGASATYFFPISAALSPAVDVVAVQYPGRQERRHEPCRESVDELADELTVLIRDLSDRPFALFGHSLGATVAYEVARRLEVEGIAATALFASGRRAPSAHRDETVHLRDDAGVLAEVRALGGSDAQLLEDDEIVAMVLPAIRADYKAAETYRYTPGQEPRCDIVALVGESDPKVSIAEAEAWAGHTSGGFESHVFPGGHFYLNTSIPAVLDVVSARLGTGF